MTDIGGVKRVRFVFDKQSTNTLFQGGRMRRLFTRSTRNKLMFTPIVGAGKEQARSIGRKNSPINMGDEVSFNEKNGCAELVFFFGTADAIVYFPTPGTFRIYKDDHEYFLDKPGLSSYEEFGTVEVSHVDAYNEDDIVKLNFSFNVAASSKYFSSLLDAWGSDVTVTGRAALISRNGKVALNFSPGGDVSAFSKVWVKCGVTVKCDFSKDCPRTLNFKPGWRYRLWPDANDPTIVYLEELSEINYFRQIEHHDFPVVSASIVSVKED